mmetsp:Transcript_100610/g.305320  ORF Transcript_100610/g.305320 Transcript_100610/m.305320 type:complete len:577 (+) Transcript_100610:3-1733(+)
MIHYESRGTSFLRKVFRVRGSVIGFAAMVALPNALLTVLVKYIQDNVLPPYMQENMALTDSAAWSAFSFLVGFLIVFRTGQAYNRFWDGATSTHRMHAEWLDACTSVMAFCKHSKADEKVRKDFQHRWVRLFSVLHAVALAEIEDCNSESIEDIRAFKMELLNAEGLDPQSLMAIKVSDAKVELVFQWIQQIIVECIETGVMSIPPPLLSRSFNELANGMVAFHEALKITTIPFPFPYAQACHLLLVIHWILVPFIICQWSSRPWWAAILSFIQVLVMWSLNCIAVEIENPFGRDANDLDTEFMQLEMNRHLLLLLQPSTLRTPMLSEQAKSCVESGGAPDVEASGACFAAIWENLQQPAERALPEQAQCPRSMRTSLRRVVFEDLPARGASFLTDSISFGKDNLAPWPGRSPRGRQQAENAGAAPGQFVPRRRPGLPRSSTETSRMGRESSYMGREPSYMEPACGQQEWEPAPAASAQAADEEAPSCSVSMGDAVYYKGQPCTVVLTGYEASQARCVVRTVDEREMEVEVRQLTTAPPQLDAKPPQEGLRGRVTCMGDVKLFGWPAPGRGCLRSG